MPTSASRDLRTARRSVRLFRLFLVEQTEPDRFYTAMAHDALALIRLHTDVRGAVVVDVGAGRPQFAAVLTEAGARYVAVDLDADLVGGPPAACVVARGEQLPLADGSVDVVLSSNVAEHVPRPFDLADELLRVVRPGGTLLLSYPMWLSANGGHETSPWHYLGGHRARRRYERRHGHPPKNAYGSTMFAMTAAAGLRWARRQQQADVLAAVPRYHPWWAHWVVRLPGLRELLTWNLLLVLRKR